MWLVKSLVVVMAMRAESAPLVAALGATPVALKTAMPIEGFQATIRGCLVTVVVNGRHPRHGVDLIGTDAATITTAYALEKFRPDFVLCAGTAGGRRSSGSRIGEIVVAHERFVYHDRRIPLPGFKELGVGSFPSADLSVIALGHGFTLGVISTGNSFGETADDLKMLDESGAVAIDMESAAVASVCELQGVPCGGIRIIANFIDDPEESPREFERELGNAVERLSAVLLQVIDELFALDD